MRKPLKTTRRRGLSATAAALCLWLVVPALADSPPASRPATSQPAWTQAISAARAASGAGQPRRARELLESACRRWPDEPAVWEALVDHYLRTDQPASALQTVSRAGDHFALTARLHLLAAQAYCRLGCSLGRTRLLRLPGAKAGQFHDGWLLVELREPPDTFLCCGPRSAFYHLRRALDSGLRDPAASVLHARLWCELGRPELALELLRAADPLLEDQATADQLAEAAELALGAGDVEYYLRLVRLQARREPQRRTALLAAACRQAADVYAARGEERMCIELLRRATRLEPQDAETLLRLADLLWESARRQEAADCYRRVLSLQPQHPRRRELLGRLAP